MISFIDVDKSIFVWINTYWSNPVFDLIMPWISRLADAALICLWIVFLGLLKYRRLARANKAGRGPRRHRAIITASFFFLCMALIYGVNAGVFKSLKHVFHRSRPFIEQTVILRVSPTTASGLSDDGSFPSGHACSAFMIAALFSKQFRRKCYFFYGLAAMVALSRVYLGVHYPSDVLVGSLLGLVITWFMLYLYPLRTKIAWNDFL